MTNLRLSQHDAYCNPLIFNKRRILSLIVSGLTTKKPAPPPLCSFAQPGRTTHTRFAECSVRPLHLVLPPSQRGRSNLIALFFKGGRQSHERSEGDCRGISCDDFVSARQTIARTPTLSFTAPAIST